MRLVRWLPLALIAVLLPLGQARSTTVEHLDLPELVSRAEKVAWGDVVSARPEWDESRTRIYTRVRLAPREMLKGDFESIIEMKLPGGELDGRAYVIHGMPRFADGMEVVLHVTAPHPRSGLVAPVGLAQGVFVIDRTSGRGVAVRDTRDLNIVTPGAPGGRSGDVQRESVEDLLARTRAEVARQKAGK